MDAVHLWRSTVQKLISREDAPREAHHVEFPFVGRIRNGRTSCDGLFVPRADLTGTLRRAGGGKQAHARLLAYLQMVKIDGDQSGVNFIEQPFKATFVVAPESETANMTVSFTSFVACGRRASMVLEGELAAAYGSHVTKSGLL